MKPFICPNCNGKGPFLRFSSPVVVNDKNEVVGEPEDKQDIFICRSLDEDNMTGSCNMASTAEELSE